MNADEALTKEAMLIARQLSLMAKASDDKDSFWFRGDSFVPNRGGDWQCPHCWVRDHQRHGLRSTPGTDEYDHMHCDRCFSEFVIPL